METPPTPVEPDVPEDEGDALSAMLPDRAEHDEEHAAIMEEQVPLAMIGDAGKESTHACTEEEIASKKLREGEIVRGKYDG